MFSCPKLVSEVWDLCRFLRYIVISFLLGFLLHRDLLSCSFLCCLAVRLHACFFVTSGLSLLLGFLYHHFLALQVVIHYIDYLLRDGVLAADLWQNGKGEVAYQYRGHWTCRLRQVHYHWSSHLQAGGYRQESDRAL